MVLLVNNLIKHQLAGGSSLQCQLLGLSRSTLYYRPCGPGDERLAANWHCAGVSLETVRRAILLGSVRKSMRLIDRPGGEPVRRLRYFAGLLEEVRTEESFPAQCWQHLEFNLRCCERLWRDGRAEAPEGARPDLERADLFGGARKPSSAAGVETEETG